jgi:hypothetical protein
MPFILILAFIILLLSLVYLNKHFEPMISSEDAGDYASILLSDDKYSDKVSNLQGVEVDDNELKSILSGTKDDDEKIGDVISYFSDLLEDRNTDKKSIYETIDSNLLLRYDQFIGLLNYVYNEKYLIKDKLSLIKSLNIKEPTFANIINKTIKNTKNNYDEKIKIYGTDPDDPNSDVVTPNISSLLNEILLGSYPTK